MGTTLTGTTPQDTYDSLIKVTDNGPLSSTAKYLSDGLGNDSALALSTSKVGIGTTSPTGKLTVSSGAAGGGYNSDYDELVLSNAGRAGINILSSATEFSAIIMGGKADNTTGGIYHNASTNMLSLATQDAFRLNIDNTGNVGIGTTSPTGGYKLDLRGRAITYNSGYLADFVSTESNASAIQLYADNTNVSIVQGGTSAVPLTFFVGGTEKMRIQTGGGISFNGDTAAANALDDYEEGTWTPSLTFNGGGIGISYSSQGGKYTKIGNVVHYSFRFTLTSKGSSTGAVRIEGLPFTVGNTNTADFTGGAIGAIENITFSTFPIALCIANTNYLVMEEGTSGGVLTSLTNADMTDTSTLRVTGFYYV